MENLRARFAGLGPLQSQDETRWEGPFPLPPVVARFYAQVGPLGREINAAVGHAGITIPGLEVWIPPLQRLWRHQAGYRWHGISGEPIEDWPSHWLVIADLGADPFILDMHDGRILFARHGRGHWDADVFLDDLPTLMAALAAVGAVYADAGDDLYSDDEDGGIREEHQETALHALAQLLGSRPEAACVLESLRS